MEFLDRHNMSTKPDKGNLNLLLIVILVS